MGTNNLITKSTGDISREEDFNQYRNALIGSHVPRDKTGSPSDLSGSLGTEELKWIRAHIANGYWSAGDIKSHHSYNGILPIDQGWFPCDGSLISETTYDLLHGAGSWAKYIVNSIFEAKHSPNLLDRLLVGTDNTTEDGAIVINPVGNPQHEIDIEHLHSINSHNHQWYKKNGGTGTSGISAGQYGSSDADQTYNSSGSPVDFLGTGGGLGVLNIDAYTDNTSTNTNNSLATDKNIQPESIEVEFYLRII